MNEILNELAVALHTMHSHKKSIALAMHYDNIIRKDEQDKQFRALRVLAVELARRSPISETEQVENWMNYALKNIKEFS